MWRCSGHRLQEPGVEAGPSVERRGSREAGGRSSQATSLVLWRQCCSLGGPKSRLPTPSLALLSASLKRGQLEGPKGLTEGFGPQDFRAFPPAPAICIGVPPPAVWLPRAGGPRRPCHPVGAQLSCCSFNTESGQSHEGPRLSWTRGPL